MAKNYTFAEAVKIINAGTDMESITDIGRRYPTLLHKVTKVAAKAGEDFVDLMSFMPDYLTANKVNSALKNAAGDAETEDADSDTDEATKAEATESGAVDYESMSAKQLWDILGKAGLRKTAKSTKKADLVAACQAMDAAKADGNDAEADEPAESNQYEGKSAMDLFKECKKRGLKVAPKKPAKFYADMLVKDDAEQQAAADDGDSWDDNEPAEKPAKEVKKEKKVTSKKEEANTEEDDDWDI